MAMKHKGEISIDTDFSFYQLEKHEHEGGEESKEYIESLSTSLDVESVQMRKEQDTDFLANSSLFGELRDQDITNKTSQTKVTCLFCLHSCSFFFCFSKAL